MRALLGLGDIVTNVNVENVGQIANLPLGAVVETNAQFSRGQIRPLTAGSLPPSVHSVIARHVRNQELVVEAALARNKDWAFQAVYDDPASGLPVDEAWEMFNAMLRATQEYLPGWDID